MKISSDKYLTINQTAEMLGVSIQRIYQMDALLDPVIMPRGSKMRTRYYRLNKVLEIKETRDQADTFRAQSVLDAHQALYLRVQMSAERAEVPCRVTLEQVVALVGKVCHLCGVASRNVDRIDAQRAFDPDNIAPFCSRCYRFLGGRGVADALNFARSVVKRHPT